MSDFLIRSLVLSAVLTVGLNLFLGWQSRRPSRDPEAVDVPSYGGPSPFEPPPSDQSPFDPPPAHQDQGRPRVQVFFPWKAMLIGSIGLTILLNLIPLLTR